jgi:phosphoglycerate dehydrogenase-like enzyme
MEVAMTGSFRVGISDSLIREDGSSPLGDVGVHLLASDPRTDFTVYQPTVDGVTPDDLAGLDGVIALGERFTADSFKRVDRLIAIGRFGVGYDRVDTAACTSADIALFITPDGVRRPVASSILALLRSLSLKIPQKALYTQSGQQDSVLAQVGTGLIGRTVGSIGVGNIGKDFFKLVAPLEMRPLAYDPYVRQEDLDPLGVTLVALETLLDESDFVCVNCPLTGDTHKLINAKRLARMKPSAYLINTARGPIVDTDALVTALQQGKLAGAGLDCTDPEPLPVGHPLLAMDNVIATSHRIVFTDQLVQGIGYADVEGMRQLARGQIPAAVVNREVLDRPGFRAKLERWRA